MAKTISIHKVHLILSVVIMGVLSVQAQEARMPKIAIGSFEYKGPFRFEDGTDSFVDMISTALIRTRRFELVERHHINEALREMGLGEAGVVNPEDSQRLGTLVKADLILFGSITQASLDDKAVTVEGVSAETRTMRMAVDIRIIDAKTGEIKTAETIDRAKTTAKSVHVSGGVQTTSASRGLSGDVMRDVANDIVNKLVQSVYPIYAGCFQSSACLPVWFPAKLWTWACCQASRPLIPPPMERRL